MAASASFFLPYIETHVQALIWRSVYFAAPPLFYLFSMKREDQINGFKNIFKLKRKQNMIHSCKI